MELPVHDWRLIQYANKARDRVPRFDDVDDIRQWALSELEKHGALSDEMAGIVPHALDESDWENIAEMVEETSWFAVSERGPIIVKALLEGSE